MTRRDLNLLLPLLASGAAVAQDKKKLPSGAFKFEELPVKAGGENRTRAVLNGATHKGSAVEIHLTELGPGMAPHAPHRHSARRDGAGPVWRVRRDDQRYHHTSDSRVSGIRGVQRRARMEKSDDRTYTILRDRAGTGSGIGEPRNSQGSKYPLSPRIARPSGPSKNDRNCSDSCRCDVDVTIARACSIV